MSVKHKLLQAAAGANTGDNAWFLVLDTETTNSNARARQVALDSAGNIYAVGLLGAGFTYVMKSNKFGEVLWQQTSTSTLECVAVNSEDDVIIGGTDDSRFYLAKLDSDGNFVWQYRYAPQNAGRFTDIAIDPVDDDICATGPEAGFNNQKDTAVMRFDTDGNLLVRKVRDEGTDVNSYMSSVPAIAANSLSEMISVTYHIGTFSTGIGCVLTVLGDNGSKSWAKSFDTQFLGGNDPGDAETFVDVAVNANNEIFALGWSRSWNFNNGPSVVKIFHGDNFGNEISHKIFNLGGLYPQPGHRDHTMLPESIALDSESNVIVSGYVYPKDGSSNHVSGFVFKATASGSVQWFRFIDCRTSSGQDIVHHVQVDSNDDIILGGKITQDDTNQNFAFIAKLPGDGSGLGEYTDGSTYRIFYREGDFTTNSSSINAMDSNGGDFSANTNVASMESANNVLSDATSTTNPTYITAKETTSGYWLAHKSWDGTGSTTSNITFLGQVLRDAAVDNLGNVIAAGQVTTGVNVVDSFVVKYDSTGDVLWEKRFAGINNEIFYGVEVDSNNNIYVTGQDDHNGGNSVSTVTLKLNPDGDVLWDVERGVANGPDDIAVDITIDSNDNVYVLAQTEQLGGSETDTWIIKYNPADGSVPYDRYYGVGTNTNDRFNPDEITIDSNDRVIFTGAQTQILGGGVSTQGTYLAVFDSSGSLSWQKAIYNDNQGAHVNGGSKQRGLAVDSQDNIYLTFNAGDLFGNGITHCCVLKFDSSGNLVWERHLNTVENAGGNTSSAHKIAIDSNDNIVVVFNTSDGANFVKLDTSGEIQGPALRLYSPDTLYGDIGILVTKLIFDSNDDMVIVGYESNPQYSNAVLKIPNDFARIEKDKIYYGLQENYEFGISTPIFIAKTEAGQSTPYIGITAGGASLYGSNVGGDVGEVVVAANTSLTPNNWSSNFRYLNHLDLVTTQDEFLTTYNYENYLVSSVTVNVDNVFSTATDGTANPVVQYPYQRYQFNRYAPGEWFERAFTSSGSFMFNNSNRALVGFESDISATDVAALIDVDFDNQTYTTLLNDSNFTSTGFNNIRYVEGGSHLFVSQGSANQPGGYRFDTQSAFTPSLPGTAGNNNSYKFYDPILNSVHEGSYDTQSVVTDLWTFQANTATVLTEDASNYVNQGVDVGQRHWVPISMDEDYIYWIDHERCGYSEKGSTVNDTITDGTYTILASTTGIANNPGNNDTWAWRDSDALPDIFGNIWMRSSNSADTNFNKYRRIYRDPSTGIPQITSTSAWEDPLANFVPQSAGSYAYFHRFESVGRPDWQTLTLRIYDADAGLTWFPKFKIYGGTPSASAYNYVFEGPYGLDLPGVETDAKTLFNRTIDSNTQFTVTLHRMP